MPASVLQVNWLNLNSQRKYPLADDATSRDTSASFFIPDEFLVGLRLSIGYGADVLPGRFFLRQIYASPGGYGLTFAYQPATGDSVDVASTRVPAAAHTLNATYQLAGIAPFEDAAGHVVVGKLDSINRQPPGMWAFALADGRLDPHAVLPAIRGVSSLRVVNNGQVSARMYGDITLVAGRNAQLLPILSEDADPVIMVSAISGEGTIEECACTDDPGEPIRTINGAPGPDFNLIGSECLEVQNIAGGVRLVDTCSRPCAGCPDLEAITQDLERLRQEAINVRAFGDRLATSVDTMSLVVLGSRIGDRSCVTCD